MRGYSHEKTFEDPVLGKVRIVKGRAYKNMSIRVRPSRGVTVSIPPFVTYQRGKDFFASRRDEVIAMHERLSARSAESAVRYAADNRTDDELRAAALTELIPRLAELAARYGFTYGSVSVRTNVSRWGSCSRRGGISLNLRLVQIPPLLRDHILLHELCHLRHFDHGQAFHALLEQLDRDNLARVCSEMTGRSDEMDNLLAHIITTRSAFPVSYTFEQQLKEWQLPRN